MGGSFVFVKTSRNIFKGGGGGGGELIAKKVVLCTHSSDESTLPIQCPRMAQLGVRLPDKHHIRQ